jgi:hypothetical protein
LICCDQDGIFLIDYLAKGQTINSQYHLSLLVQLKDTLKEKRCEKINMAVLILHVYIPTHLKPRTNWPTWASNVLITDPVLWIWPRQTTSSSLG